MSGGKNIKEELEILYKALDECEEIIGTLKQENEELKKVCAKIKNIEQNLDLSKIRGD